MSLFSKAIFTLFVLILLNFLLQKLRPKSALRRSDLSITLSCDCDGIDHIQTPNAPLSGIYCPPLLVCRKRWKCLMRLFSGGLIFFHSIAYQVVAWTFDLLIVFLFVLCFLLICINIIIRKQFTDRERLTYPITWLPLTINQSPPVLLKNRLMWTGSESRQASGR